MSLAEGGGIAMTGAWSLFNHLQIDFGLRTGLGLRFESGTSQFVSYV